MPVSINRQVVKINRLVTKSQAFSKFPVAMTTESNFVALKQDEALLIRFGDSVYHSKSHAVCGVFILI